MVRSADARETENKKLKNKTGALIPICALAEALAHHQAKVTKVKIPTNIVVS
ncbi:unnamed protein product [Penicillium roqueforti FM164]|uniref:Genomic scaffold, ProqFM164S01 n=1 Tax=Penicillium roqueforti (strain FM164) TaxID=1365484 RepID=W6PSW9_PENRF|nr:unnamed protein product [Penicillium roqueforti FM164]